MAPGILTVSHLSWCCTHRPKVTNKISNQSVSLLAFSYLSWKRMFRFLYSTTIQIFFIHLCVSKWALNVTQRQKSWRIFSRQKIMFTLFVDNNRLWPIKVYSLIYNFKNMWFIFVIFFALRRRKGGVLFVSQNSL